MNTTKITPMITVIESELEPVKQFYQRHFGFVVTFEGRGYLGLQAPGSGAELAFMTPTSEGEEPFPGKGLTLSLEVADVDAEHDRLRQEGMNIVQPPRDNPWGDRNIIVQDPAGVWLYIYKTIPMSPEFRALMKE